MNVGKSILPYRRQSRYDPARRADQYLRQDHSLYRATEAGFRVQGEFHFERCGGSSIAGWDLIDIK